MGFSTPGDAPDNWFSSPGGLDAPFYTVAASSVFHESYGGRENVWEINEDNGLEFYIPNFSGGDWKEVYVQITYLVDEYLEPWVIPDLWVDGDYSWDGYFDDWMEHDNFWITDAYWFEIEPNPEGEWISLYSENSYGDPDYPDYPAYIDQVVIDTICIPEPATLGLLVMGGLFLLKRRAK